MKTKNKQVHSQIKIHLKYITKIEKYINTDHDKTQNRHEHY